MLCAYVSLCHILLECIVTCKTNNAAAKLLFPYQWQTESAIFSALRVNGLSAFMVEITLCIYHYIYHLLMFLLFSIAVTRTPLCEQVDDVISACYLIIDHSILQHNINQMSSKRSHFCQCLLQVLITALLYLLIASQSP